ncbi:5'/3'-nucleotidase SurE [bacterium]|nr:5'/3'-nucleotidase SurE [bacterium]
MSVRSPAVRSRSLCVACAALIVLIAACDNSSSDARDDSTTTTAAPEPAGTEVEPLDTHPGTEVPMLPALRVLLTNDDGVDSEGLDAIATALLERNDVELTIVAPAMDTSGSAHSVTDPAPDTATETTTASGHAALAVDGLPADAVNFALTNVFSNGAPDLVISGNNDGMNVGPVALFSGTVGAARTAAARGIPAIALSTGVYLDFEPDFASSLNVFLDFFDRNATTISGDTDLPAQVWSINVPSCGDTGEIQGVVETEMSSAALSTVDIEAMDCSSNLSDFEDDVSAFASGFATITIVPEELVLAAPDVRSPAVADGDVAVAISVAPSVADRNGPITFTVTGSGFTLPVFIVSGIAPDPCTIEGLEDYVSVDVLDLTNLTAAEPDENGSFTAVVTYDVPEGGILIAAADPGEIEAAAVLVCPA